MVLFSLEVCRVINHPPSFHSGTEFMLPHPTGLMYSQKEAAIFGTD